MTDIAAAIGLEQLKKLPHFNQKSKENAKYLDEKLGDAVGIKIPYVLEKAEHAYHQYTIKCDNRDVVIQRLKENGVGFGIYYPKPMHFFSHLKRYGHNDLKVSERLANEVLSLPVHPAISGSDLERIVSCF